MGKVWRQVVGKAWRREQDLEEGARSGGGSKGSREEV
jgi:hypothetical protein